MLLHHGLGTPQGTPFTNVAALRHLSVSIIHGNALAFIEPVTYKCTAGAMQCAQRYVQELCFCEWEQGDGLGSHCKRVVHVSRHTYACIRSGTFYLFIYCEAYNPTH